MVKFILELKRFWIVSSEVAAYSMRITIDEEVSV